ncbi:MAG: ribonuclease Z [Acidimicrobiia bacterium]|nr:MAG: ribonuclease Z [Acidimicrobiia bacterium]
MSPRELVVLGTASQAPTRYRNHNGYFLRWDDRAVLFDPGEGTQRQMLLVGVRATEITRICVTHFHGDHCLGLPGVLQRLSLDRVPRAVAVHYPASGARYFAHLRDASIYDDRATVVARPVGHDGVQDDDGVLRVVARRLDHGVEAYGYRLEEPDGRTLLPDRLDALGVSGPAIGELAALGELRVGGRTVRIEDVSVHRPGQVVAFVMDTRPCDAAVALARHADLLVCESTFLAEEAGLAREYGHMTARDAALLASEAGVRRLVLSHFSQRHPDERRYLEEALPIHADTVAASDGLRVPVPRRRRTAPGREAAAAS